MTSVSPVQVPSGPPPPPIRRATGAERLPVLARLLGRDRDHAARFESFAAQEQLTLDHLWGCFDEDGRVLSAALLSPYPGRTAMLTLATVRCNREEAAARRTIAAALDDLGDLDLALAQALLEPRHALEIGALRGAGFHPLATLASMERPMLRSRRAGAPESLEHARTGVALDGYDDSIESQRALTALLEATYRDTLDCPGLAGIRKPAEVLEGHRRGGRFDPRLWTILRIDGAAAGALLLNAAPHVDALELIYLGLIPEARGRGCGRLLIDHAISVAAARGVGRLMLAVDEENAPALRLYRAAGFRRVMRRTALIRPLGAR